MMGVKVCTIKYSNDATVSSLSQRIYGGRNRCEKLKSLRAEIYVTSLIDVLLFKGKVCNL